jgi:hypothetical protein
MEGDAGAGRLNPTDVATARPRCAFNPAGLQRFSPQFGPAGRGEPCLCRLTPLNSQKLILAGR